MLMPVLWSVMRATWEMDANVLPAIDKVSLHYFALL